jgi:hypothetical protein
MDNTANQNSENWGEPFSGPRDPACRSTYAKLMIIILTRLSHEKTVANPEVDEEQRKITKEQEELNGDFEEILCALLCWQATYSPVLASQANDPWNTDLNMDDKESKKATARKSENGMAHQFGDASETISKIKKLAMPYLAGYLDLEDVQDTPEAACHAIINLIIFDDRFDDRQDVLDNAMHFLLFRYGQIRSNGDSQQLCSGNGIEETRQSRMCQLQSRRTCASHRKEPLRRLFRLGQLCYQNSLSGAI